MKLSVFILISFTTLTASAQLVMTNNLIGTFDASSYDSLNSTTAAGYAGIIGGYFKAGLNLVYPKPTNMIVSISSGGANMETQVTNHVPQVCPPIWTWATSNKVVARNFVLVNDNGGYQSNTVYPFGVAYYNTPTTMYNGTATTNEGLNLTVQHFFLGANVSGSGNSDTAAQSRNLASLQWMKELSLNPVDTWNDAGSNGLFAVNMLTDSDFYFGGGHLTPKTSLQHVMAFWRGLGLKTNLYSSIIDWSAVSIASSNGIVITSLVKSGNTLSFNYIVDCVSPACDLLPGISNQVATTLWTNVPNFGNMFTEVFRFTNLSASVMYTFTSDDVPVYTASGTTWMAGINFATNTVPNTPENIQKMLVLYDVRDEYGVNHTNGLSTHAAGTTLPSGADLINYGSICFGLWPAKHGPSLVNDSTVQTALTSMWNRAIVTHNDSQQVVHAGKLIQAAGSSLPWTHK